MHQCAALLLSVGGCLLALSASDVLKFHGRGGEAATTSVFIAYLSTDSVKGTIHEHLNRYNSPNDADKS